MTVPPAALPEPAPAPARTTAGAARRVASATAVLLLCWLPLLPFVAIPSGQSRHEETWVLALFSCSGLGTYPLGACYGALGCRAAMLRSCALTPSVRARAFGGVLLLFLLTLLFAVTVALVTRQIAAAPVTVVLLGGALKIQVLAGAYRRRVRATHPCDASRLMHVFD